MVKSQNIILTLCTVRNVFGVYDGKPPTKVMNHLRCAEKNSHCEMLFSDDTISSLSKEDFHYHSGNKANFMPLVRKKLEQKTCHATYTTGDADHETAVTSVNKLLWEDKAIIEDTDLLILMWTPSFLN